MVRDRLQEMKIMIGDQSEARNSVRAPKTFQQTMDKAYEDIEGIERNVQQLFNAHNETLSSIPSKSSTRIDAIVEEIHQAASRIKSVLMKLKSSVNAEDKSARGRMKYAQYQSLSKAFTDAIFEFHEEQLRYRDKCKNQIRKQLEVSGRPVSDEVLEDMLEKGNVFVEDSSTMAIEEARAVVDEVKARHRDIIRLEESIRQMKKLFEDIASMIEEQGEMVTRIEDYVSTAVEFVGRGQQDLQKAEESQKAARRKKLYCLAFVVILITVIIIVVAVLK